MARAAPTPEPRAAEPAEVTAVVQGFTWLAEDRSAAILRARGDDGNALSVVAPGEGLSPGLRCRFRGRWEEHPRWGRQFRADLCQVLTPTDQKGVIAYLLGVAPGVGEKTARKLWDAYGTRAVETLRLHPDQVARAGIMPLAGAAVASSELGRHQRYEAVRVELLALLSGRGFHLKAVFARLLDLWGDRAPQRIRRDPYCLLTANVPSCGWERCDRLYLDLGMDPAGWKRQALAGISWLRGEGKGKGHTWHAIEDVGKAIMDRIGKGADPVRALRLARRAGMIRVRKEGAGAGAGGGEKRWVALESHARHEELIARKVQELLAWTTPFSLRHAERLRTT